MPRSRTPIGTHGVIGTSQIGPHEFQAAATFRDFDGRSRRVRRSGRTAAQAVHRLREALASREMAYAPVSDVNGSTTVSQLAGTWLESLLSSHSGPTAETISGYRRDLARVLQAIGSRTLLETRAGVLETVLQHMPSPNLARKNRSHLKRMFDFAVRHDALLSNPVVATSTVPKSRPTIKIIDPKEFEAVRQGVQEWCQGIGRSGPRNDDMADLVDMLFATGGRIGELLALRWSDLDLAASPSTISITGSLRYVPGTGTIRTDPKTADSVRTLALPHFALEMLRRRRARMPVNDLDAVFATRNGTWHQVSNMERRWRAIRTASGIRDHTFHTFRRTVATLVDRAEDERAASKLLGHSSESVTRTHYIQRATSTVDVAYALEVIFAPNPESDAING